MRSCLGATLVVLLIACHSSTRQAETVSTPFPGTLLSIQAGRCTADGCLFNYRVRITNPTNGDANVQECILPTAGVRLPIMGIAGFDIAAHATNTVSARFILPGVDKEKITDWAGRDLSCVGLDWHGDPPI